MKWTTMIVATLICAQPVIAGDRSYGERLKYRNAAVKGQVLMGMTASEVKKARGRPLKINRSQGKYGVHEQWVYDQPDGPRYIYLDDGEVTSTSN